MKHRYGIKHCTAKGCKRPVNGHGLCSSHYMKAYRRGELKTLPHNAIGQFFYKVIVEENGCWYWTGAKKPKGYGWFKGTGVHRWSYRYFVGEFDEVLEIDHLCKNPSCVNPDHLEPVTRLENLLRSDNLTTINRNKTHCVQGHPLSGDNLITRKNKEGQPVYRVCKTCQNKRNREWMRKSRTTNS